MNNASLVGTCPRACGPLLIKPQQKYFSPILRSLESLQLVPVHNQTTTPGLDLLFHGGATFFLEAHLRVDTTSTSLV